MEKAELNARVTAGMTGQYETSDLQASVAGGPVDKNLAHSLRFNGCSRTDCWTMVVCDIRLLLFVLVFITPFALTPLLLQFWRRLQLGRANEKFIGWMILLRHAAVVT
jgi:hypothetical protein